MLNEATSKGLCLELLSVDREEEVIEVLNGYGLWEQESLWRPYGDTENNFSIIGNQQSKPIAAMVEKLVNSVDAVLMRECLKRRINPESNDAPQSIAEALEQFFAIKRGNLADGGKGRQEKLAQEIGLIATGTARNPSYIVFDRGEGQTPNTMPTTLLSLAKSNKMRIPFVQGKFNMGGTGVLQFCGTRNLQLVISRRNIHVAKVTDSSDPTSEYWGFTLVRRVDPEHGRRSSLYKYLAPDKQILKFRSETLNIPALQNRSDKGVALDSGTILKMYEYDMTGAKRHIRLDLHYRASLLLPGLGLPIRLYETRDFGDPLLEMTLLGLQTRLEEDRRDRLENGFPTHAEIIIHGQQLIVHIYAFKKGASVAYREKEGVVFSINGQTHGVLKQSFFNRCGMGYLAESLLLIVECDKISGRDREDLFMNSRDRLREGSQREDIEDQLVKLIQDHEGLRRLRERRRREEINDKLADARPLEKILEEVVFNSPGLIAFLSDEGEIKNPFKSRLAQESEVFVGKRFPTYFRPLHPQETYACPINMPLKLRFETDVENDYFGRNIHPGTFLLYAYGERREDYRFSLWDGVANLSIEIPDDARVGDYIELATSVYDETQSEAFNFQFMVRVQPALNRSEKETQAMNDKNSKKNKLRLSSWLGSPVIRDVNEHEWEELGLDRYSALQVRGTETGAYDFFVNIDNVHLRTEIKRAPKNVGPRMLETRFRFGMVLIGLAMLKDDRDRQTEWGYTSTDEESIEERIAGFTRVVAPMLLPMIDHLGNLELEDASGSGLDTDSD